MAPDDPTLAGPSPTGTSVVASGATPLGTSVTAPDPARPMLPVPYRVRSRTRETADVATLCLTPADGSPRLPFAPGQFTMMYVPGVGEVPISVSGDPDADELVQTIREVGPVSAALRRLEPGDIIGIRGPFGTAWPVEEARGNDILVLAGGLGMAPVRPILYQVLHDREAFGRVALLYGTREEPDLLFRRELQRWRTDLTLEILVTLDHASPSWRGHVGVVTSLIEKASFEPQGVTAFVCGPEAMMRFSARALREIDVPPEAIHLSLERNMKCGIGLCGHCQIGPFFVCKDGPVTSLDRAERWLHRREV